MGSRSSEDRIRDKEAKKLSYQGVEWIICVVIKITRKDNKHCHEEKISQMLKSLLNCREFLG